jgi:Integrase core domain
LRRPLECAQYVSLLFGQRCREVGIRISMGARASALDNAVCEAFFGSLKRERLNRRSWPTRREAQSAIFEWIEGWYNPRRLHSTLGYRSPRNYEQLSLEKEDMKEEAAQPLPVHGSEGGTGSPQREHCRLSRSFAGRRCLSSQARATPLTAKGVRKNDRFTLGA